MSPNATSSSQILCLDRIGVTPTGFGRWFCPRSHEASVWNSSSVLSKKCSSSKNWPKCQEGKKCLNLIVEPERKMNLAVCGLCLGTHWKQGCAFFSFKVKTKATPSILGMVWQNLWNILTLLHVLTLFFLKLLYDFWNRMPFYKKNLTQFTKRRDLRKPICSNSLLPNTKR